MLNKFLRRFLLSTLFFTGFANAIPTQPPNGGTGIANNPASTVTINGAYALQFNLLSATSANFAPGNKIYVDCAQGNNANNGSTLSKLATITAAESLITTATPSNPFEIEVSASTCHETNLVLKPNVSINASPAAVIIVGTLSLDTSWPTNVGNTYIQGGTWSWTTANLDFSTLLTQGNLFFQNLFLDKTAGDLLLTLTGNPDAPMQIFLNNVNALGSHNFNLVGNDISGLTTNTFIDDITITSTSTTQQEVFFLRSSLDSNGYLTFNANGTQPLIFFQSGDIDFKTVTLNGANAFMYTDSDSFTQLPVVTGGAGYTLLSIAEGSAVNYTPLNYTPVTSNEPANVGNPSVDAHFRGIDTALGALGADDQLQDVYDNGTPGQKGSINLTSDNLNPLAVFNSYNAGNQESMTVVNSASSSPTAWGYGFRAINSSSNYKDYAHIYANIENNLAGSESGSLGLYASSYGTLTQAVNISGINEDVTVNWPAHIPNGTQTYSSLILLTGDQTYAGQFIGYTVVSDDVSVHNIDLPATYYSTNADDTYQIQTQANNPVTITPSGSTINGSGSVVTIPVNTLGTLRLVNAAEKAWELTQESAPQSPVVFSAYATTAQSGVTGAGTLYTVQFPMQTGDTSPDFNTSTGIFTAPLTGFYQFSSSLNCAGFNSNNTLGILFLQTTSQYFVLSDNNPYSAINSAGALNIGGSATVFLNVGDTASVQLLVDLNSTDNVDILGDPATAYTYFSGSYIGATAGGGSDGKIDVSDDNSTNATMYPVYVSGNSGSQPTYVSSDGYQWNPNTQTLKIGNDNFGNNISISGEVIRWGNGPSSDDVFSNWKMGELAELGVPNWGIYDYNNSMYLMIADTEGFFGPNATTLYFEYPYNTFPNSTSANQLMATDGNNYVSSIPNTLGEANVSDDNSTNATMYPLWVSANSGNQATKVSSDKIRWNPSNDALTIIDDLGNYTTVDGLSTTYTQNDSEGFRPTYTEYATVASGSLFQAGILDGSRFGYDVYDSVNGFYVFYTDPYGNVGNTAAIHFQYSLVLESGVSSNHLLATDGSNNVVSDTSGLSPQFTGLNLSGLTPNSIVATDGSNNLISTTIPGVSQSYGVLGYSLNTNATTFSGSSTYVPFVLNSASTVAATGHFSVNSSTGEITYTGPVPNVLRISTMTAGVAASGSQNLVIAPAVNVGSGYVVYTYLGMPQIMGTNPLGVTTTALVPVAVSPSTFRMEAENNTGTTSFTAQTIYFSIDEL